MLYNFAYLCYDSAGFTRLGSKKFRKGKTTMKKTLAIVLALAMVLCMIPAAFAAQAKTITDKSYDLKVESYGAMDKGNPSVANASKANSITFKKASMSPVSSPRTRRWRWLPLPASMRIWPP